MATSLKHPSNQEAVSSSRPLAVKKAEVKKAEMKKAAVKKNAASSIAAKKSVAKKKTVKKPVVKKPAVKSAQNASAKKSAADKSAADKTTAKLDAKSATTEDVSVNGPHSSSSSRAHPSAVFGAGSAPKSPVSPDAFDRLDAVLDSTLNDMCDLLGVGPLSDKSFSDGAADTQAGADRPAAEGGSDTNHTADERQEDGPEENDLLADWEGLLANIHDRAAAMRISALDLVDSLSDEIHRQSLDDTGRRALADWSIVFGVLAVGQLLISLFRRRF